jgi:hypothetical protein
METKQYSHPTVFDAQYGSRQVLDLLSEKRLFVLCVPPDKRDVAAS